MSEIIASRKFRARERFYGTQIGASVDGEVDGISYTLTVYRGDTGTAYEGAYMLVFTSDPLDQVVSGVGQDGIREELEQFDPSRDWPNPPLMKADYLAKLQSIWDRLPPVDHVVGE